MQNSCLWAGEASRQCSESWLVENVKVGLRVEEVASRLQLAMEVEVGGGEGSDETNPAHIISQRASKARGKFFKETRPLLRVLPPPQDTTLIPAQQALLGKKEGPYFAYLQMNKLHGLFFCHSFMEYERDFKPKESTAPQLQTVYVRWVLTASAGDSFLCSGLCLVYTISLLTPE